MVSQYQGDPQIFMGIDGPRLEFVDGQPRTVNVLENGLADLWNAVIISLFTRPGWAGNVLVSNPDEKIGSDFEETADQTISLSALNKMENSVTRALNWITSTGAARAVAVRARNPFGSNIEVAIRITLNDGSLFNMVATRNGARWLVERFV
jgi:phage gp46-like protein